MSDFDWFTNHRVTCDWDCHRARGSNGGEDRAHPAGSPVRAPYDATVSYGLYSDGASYVQFLYGNGYGHRAVHVQRQGRVSPGRVREGTQSALSDGRRGTYGAGTSTGAHIHFHGFNPQGSRIPWEDVPAPYSVTSVNPKPLSPEELESKMSGNFAIKIKARDGRTKTYFCTPNPLAVNNNKAKPFIGLIVGGGTTWRDTPILDMQYDWAYNRAVALVDGVNNS